MFLFLFAASAASLKEKNGLTQCSICNILAENIEKGLERGIEESQIKQQLKENCDKLGILADACNIIVDQSFSKLIYFLRSGESGKAACRLIGACKPTAYYENQEDDFVE
ncbi:surfactant B protein, putative [Trichomonas vaginalis G3]|uniref:Surfactant B protein, putative n=1 Tax=Trichomonas vaginalis (strain ATCC PRA-98 / G3) TaxID=412133 RepID=A2DY99_TRIV3|nr:saposin family [Trichomonas vaginalis G3]EAY14576.1 surfactant B protein, putative [Trichomonas vaginalis G3]KAI5526586.1 saposin family [Trichomonas vaginalis G3]|eukprot:XP_001326799.1 surfactant B protein [Trichomonas vaginalis G3]